METGRIMRTRTRVGGCLAVAVLLGSILPAASVGAAPPGADEPRQAAPRTVTLLTGDRVVVKGDRIRVDRGPGRAGVNFLTHRIAGHQYVIPSDAVPLLGKGKLDRRLFDVTTLLSFGYDRRTDLPLIVTYRGVKAAASVPGATVGRALPVVNGLAVRASTQDTTAFWQGLSASGAQRVWLDGLRQPTLDVSVPLIGAPTAWQAGHDGTGRTVAVLDTGIDATHPDLADRVVGQRNFTEGEEDDRDLVGHGTHVASTVAGSGAASDGRYTGVAPGAKLLDGKVCVQFGCAESWILAGMQWAAEQGADVVNMSLGGPDTPEQDPLEAAVETLTASHGTLFVIAAGNAGPGPGSVSSPSTADSAVSVGAVTKTDELADFSSRGPRVGDSALKPEITGPGVDVTAARGKDGFIGEPGQMYATISGTSMATPHVAGAAAILAQRRPDFTPAQLKAALMGAASPAADLSPYDQGAGRVDVARSINQQVLADPPAVWFGLQEWPHDDDTPVTKTVTYRNSGSGAVTLALAVQPVGGAPAGMFSVSATTVTVPAGGSAAVTATADTRVASPDRPFGAFLTATGTGGLVVQTPLAVDKDVERYDLTLDYTDRTGAPTSDYITFVFRLDEFAFHEVVLGPSTRTLRLPVGRYALGTGMFHGPIEDPDGWTIFTHASFDVSAATGDQRMAIDARRSRPISFRVAQPSATSVSFELTNVVPTNLGPLPFGLLSDTFEGVNSVNLGPDHHVDGFLTLLSTTIVRGRPDGSTLDSPFVYNLVYPIQGRMVTGFDKRVRDKDLATVRADNATNATGARGFKGSFAVLPDGFSSFPGTNDIGLPVQTTERFNTDGGLRWFTFLDVYQPGEFPEFLSTTFSSPTTYKAGRTYSERWNRAVFGPTLPPVDAPFLWATREGDTLIFVPPIFGDGAGREGYSLTTAERGALFRDGTKIVDEPFAGIVAKALPPEPATYRVEMEAARDDRFTVSTRVSAAWTFRSSDVEGEIKRLPIWVIGFAPELDGFNTAPSGRHFAVPVRLTAQPDSGVGRIRSLTVEVSYDDGVTWRRVQLANGRALLVHPRGEGFVSFRARAADSAGNTVEQTIIRAYRFAP